ncbi:MAG: hypothetical protein GVY06_02530 [Alphaproteobacteria bacterium]|jgi:hypothetical protein|nr:hypothetical protein [Alphaproteobacteria bacterium]
MFLSGAEHSVWERVIRYSRLILALAAGFAPMTSTAAINDRAGFEVIGAVVVWSADNGGSAPTAVDFLIDTGSGTSAATSGDADLISGDAHTVVTGTLVSTSDGVNSAGTMPFVLEDAPGGDFNTDTNGDGITNTSDSFTPFSIDTDTSAAVSATTSRSSFYVASNVPFSIDADTDFPSSGTNWIMMLITRLDMSVTLNGDDGLAFGSAAQFPHSGGPTGGMTSYPNLFTLLNGGNVFTGNQRTAASRGSLADQSVRFDLAYSIGAGSLSGYDLSLGTYDFEVDVTYTVFIP